MDEHRRHREFEDRFLQQLRARAVALTRRRLPADEVTIEPTSEGADALRAELERLEVFDRDALDRLPGSGSLQMRFDRRALGGLLRSTVARVRVRVLVPVERLLDGAPPEPVGREQVLDALARYKLLPRRQRPTGIVLGSATGFTPEARRLVESVTDVSLVLVGGRNDGGWDVTLPRRLEHTPWARLFELESTDERLQRLMYHLQQQAERLDSSGVAVTDLAERLGLSRTEIERLVRQACRQDSRLMTVVHEGTIHVCRTPLPQEGNAMSLWSRIRRLLRLKPTVAERVRELTAQRVRIEQQRSELDHRIQVLEQDERDLLHKGAEAPSDAERRQIAARLVRRRRELRRLRTQAQMLSQQIDIIGTHIHNLTLAERGRQVELPRSEELTAQAAEAERIMADLAANADLAAGIEVTAETPMMAEEEESILAEFRQVAEASAKAAQSAAKQPAEAAPESAAPAARESAPPAAESADKDKSETAPPEAG